jgi:hypothetical protein
MLEPRIIGEIGAAIRAASASTDAKFLKIGQRLETSVEILGRLAGTFEDLSGELRSENLQRATDDLARAASQVAAVGRAHCSEQVLLAQLTKLTLAIESRMAHMRKAVKGVDILAVNARIVAAGIGDAGADFVSFANDIRRTLKLAEASLAEFSRELARMGAQLAAATAAQLAFDERQSETVRCIPARLATSIESIAAHRARAAAAASIVCERSQDVGRRLGSAVIALQIGDVTRQRTEHVVVALGLLGEIAAPEQDADGDWCDLSPNQRESLFSLGCRLQSAQLADTVQEFDRELQQILGVLKGLAGDAREIRRLSNDAYGADGDRRGSFLGALEEEVRQALDLLKDFAIARGEADRVGVSVSDAAAGLTGHIATVRSLEADIRIMGLNTTLKSARLAERGLPLRVIAQELRSYANQIAVEAGAVLAEVENISATARPLSGQMRDRNRGDAAAVAEIMSDAVARLGVAGGSLAEALATLEQDGDAVGKLLDETVAFVAGDREIGAAMRQAAGDLGAIAPPVSPDAVDAAHGARMLTLIEHGYTMASEREIHARIADGARAIGSPPPPAVDEAALEDILF